MMRTTPLLAALLLLVGSPAAAEPLPTPPVAYPPTALLDKMPLLLAGSRYVVTPDDDAGGALLLRTKDEKLVSRISLDDFPRLATRLDGAEPLAAMQNVTTEYDPHGLPVASFSHAGLRVVFTEPNLLVFDEKTGETVYARRATWWSQPQPPESPGQEGIPKEERFRCPAPAAVLSSAWIASDHQVLLLRIDYAQPVCVCGDANEHAWHVISLPFAPPPT